MYTKFGIRFRLRVGFMARVMAIIRYLLRTKKVMMKFRASVRIKTRAKRTTEPHGISALLKINYWLKAGVQFSEAALLDVGKI